MAERYVSLFKLPENLYIEDSPVIIAAGALLKDTQSNQILAQLKFRSVSKQKILALTVEITCFDTAGRVVAEPFTYAYLDINARIGDVFGAKTPVFLPHTTTRTISVRITEVTLEAGNLWTPNEENWEPLQRQESLNLGNPEWNKQFRLQYGEKCAYQLLKQKDLWHCACGAINKDNHCYNCSLSLSNLETIDFDALRNASAKRVENEQAIAQKQIEKRIRQNQIQKTLLIIGAAILCSVLIFVIVLNFFIVPEKKYNEAVLMMNNKDYAAAYEAFSALGDYKDSEDLAKSLRIKHNLTNKWPVSVGDTITFGRYVQDNDLKRPEEIEWIVLAKEGNKILIISKYGLDRQPYNSTQKNIVWKNCTLRNWLNNDFLDSAFGDEEKSIIQLTDVSADKNPEYDTQQGEDTQDKVFLLSSLEAKRYFASVSAMQCDSTDYAERIKNSYSDYGWWLRTSGCQSDAATAVTSYGVYNWGWQVQCEYCDVRPAMWISLE